MSQYSLQVNANSKSIIILNTFLVFFNDMNFQNNIKKKALLGFVLKRYIYHQFILDTTST